jgi:hypothetical protein
MRKYLKQVWKYLKDTFDPREEYQFKYNDTVEVVSPFYGVCQGVVVKHSPISAKYMVCVNKGEFYVWAKASTMKK